MFSIRALAARERENNVKGDSAIGDFSSAGFHGSVSSNVCVGACNFFSSDRMCEMNGQWARPSPLLDVVVDVVVVVVATSERETGKCSFGAALRKNIFSFSNHTNLNNYICFLENHLETSNKLLHFLTLNNYYRNVKSKFL